jgi:hypothetical protein
MTTITLSGPIKIDFGGAGLPPNGTQFQSFGTLTSADVGEAFFVSAMPPVLGTFPNGKTAAVSVLDAYLSVIPGPGGPDYSVNYTLQNNGSEPIESCDLWFVFFHANGQGERARGGRRRT